MKQLSTAEIRDDLRELLSQTPLFAQCSDTLHDFIIDSADLRQYEASEVIVESDTQSESYSIIVRGEAKVKLSDGAVVGELSATDGFGEIGLLLDENRSASVIANELVLILTLAKPQFEECFIKFPEFGRRIAEVLAQRLSSTLQLVPSIGEQHFESESGVLSLLPTSMMQRHLIMPVETQGNIVTIGFVNEVNDSVLRRVQNFLPSMEVQPVSISLDFFELRLRFSSVVSLFFHVAHRRLFVCPCSIMIGRWR